MSVIKKNIAANFGGSIWGMIISLVFIPIYIDFLGVAAYGLVAIFTTMLAMFAVLDMGMIQTLTRELARLIVLPDGIKEMRDLLRTLEIPYLSVGIVIGLIVMMISPWISHNWINSQVLQTDSIQTAVILMGLMIAIQWPIGLYSSGLVGLQHQVVLNFFNGGIALARGLVSVLVLWKFSSTIEAFFLTQLLVSVLHILIIRHLLWIKIPARSHVPKFRIELLQRVWRFAAGVAGIGLISSLLMQLDKIILSKILSLEIFGYYAIANVVSMNAYRLFGPIYSAIYPKLTNLVASGEKKELVDFYHKSAQFLALAVFPAVAVLVFFSKDLLEIWLQNPLTAEITAPLVSILVIGTALNGIMHIPYGLQLAAGWTSLSLSFGILSLAIFGLLLVGLTSLYGVIGAAMAWPIQQALYVIFNIHLMHRRLLTKEKNRWYWADVVYPLILALAPVILVCIFKPDIIGIVMTLAFLSFTFLLSVCTVIVGIPLMRQEALKVWHRCFLTI